VKTTTVAILAALLLGLAGCGGNEHNKAPGVVENKTPQPTTGTAGTKAPTPSPTTTAGTTG
jgi:hypothetical protein